MRGLTSRAAEGSGKGALPGGALEPQIGSAIRLPEKRGKYLTQTRLLTLDSPVAEP
ncbi:MAG TPA: hypothetical protein VFS50_15710 [Meiothermus sp.]|nr:hypothetical protein [Meiothermus sp.]